MIKNPIIKGTFILSITGILTKVIGFLFKIHFTKAIGVYELGLFQLILPVLALCISFSTAGIEVAIAKRNDVRFSANCMYLSVFISLIISLCVYVLADKISVFYIKNSHCISLIKGMALTVPLTCVHNIFYSYFIGKNNALVSGLSSLYEQLARYISLFIVLYFCKGAYAAVISTFISEIVAVLYCLFNTGFGKSNKLYMKADKKLIITILKTATPITTNRIFLTLIQAVEISLIPKMLELYGCTNDEAISVLGVVTGIALPVVMLPATFVNYFALNLLPSVSKHQNSKSVLKKYHIKSVKISVVCGISCIAFFHIIGGRLTSIIFANSEVHNIINTMALSCPFAFLNTTERSILNGINKSMSILYCSLFSELICMSFIVFIVPKNGISSYITGLIISQAVASLINSLVIKKEIAKL